MSSILNALYFAGGPNEIGTYRLIEIIGMVKYSLKLTYMIILLVVFKKYIFKRSRCDFCTNIKKRVSSTGEFKNIMFLRYLKMNLFLTLLNIQVNSTQLAYKNEIYIERIDGIK